MRLNEETQRIKTLMYKENQNKILTEGSINNFIGKTIKLLSSAEEEIGSVNIISMGHVYKLDDDINRLYSEPKWCVKNCESNFFNNNNSTYLYNLYIKENFRGYGFGNQLMDYSKNIIIDNGYTYNTLIADSVNTVAKNLYKKLGYNLHFTNHKKDFYFVEL